MTQALRLLRPLARLRTSSASVRGLTLSSASRPQHGSSQSVQQAQRAAFAHGPSSTLGRRCVNMAAFSDPDFDFRRYLEERPRAPDTLYEDVLKFHQGQRGTVLDVGCGPGISLFPLVPHFQHAVGVDPSEGMIAEAGGAWEAYCASTLQGKRPDTLVEFKQGSAEKLASIADASVDLVTASQAAHWFDYAALWPELSRVLRPGGSVAFWGYGTNFLPAHPALWPQMAEFMSSRAPVLGPYWPLPGRRLLEDLLAEIPFPQDEAAWDVAGATRKMHTLAAPGVPELASPAVSYRMERVMTFEQLNGYFHTSSALSRFYKAHPERRGEKPDMIDVHVERLRDAVRAERERGIGTQEGLDDEHVRVAWPLGLMMIRKRGGAA